MEMKKLIRALSTLDWNRRSALDAAAALLDQCWKEGEVNQHIADYLHTLEYPHPAVTRTAELHSWKLYHTVT